MKLGCNSNFAGLLGFYHQNEIRCFWKPITMLWVFHSPQSLVVSRGSEGGKEVTQLSRRTEMTGNSKSINNQNSGWKVLLPSHFVYNWT